MNRSLSGSDYFHLLIDCKMLRNGLAGNISRIHLQLAKSADFSILESNLRKNKILNSVSRLKIFQRWPSLPKWKEVIKERAYLQVHTEMSNSEFRKTVLNRKVNNESGLVFVDLCHLADGTKHLVVSMHHVLFDHQGMMNFIRVLADENFTVPFFPEPSHSSFWDGLKNTVYTTIYMLTKSSGKLGTLVRSDLKIDSVPKFRTIAFNSYETSIIENNAWQVGSRIGRTPFYMATIAQTVFRTLNKREEKTPYLWISLQHNQRRKGSAGHLVSNQLSFLFFRIKDEALNSTTEAVASINRQMKQQLKSRFSERYSDLQDSLRFMPLAVYEWMVDLASKGKMSSFGYSDLGEINEPLNNFLGCEVESTQHFAPVPSPPGFNVAVLKEKGELKFIWAYVEEAVTELEIEEMESYFRNLVLKGN